MSNSWFTHGIMMLVGSIAGVMVTRTILGPDNAIDNGRQWAEDRGIHASAVWCSFSDRDEDGDVLCAAFVPSGTKETVLLLECEESRGGLCHEHGEEE